MDFKGDEVVWVEFLGVAASVVVPLFGEMLCCGVRRGGLRWCGEWCVCAVVVVTVVEKEKK